MFGLVMDVSTLQVMLKSVAEAAALGCELLAVLIIAASALEAVGRMLRHARRLGDVSFRKQIWLRFASAIILALEFTLAADIARTAIAPSWDEIGKLAAIAAIRTILNIYLERDLEIFAKPLNGSPNAK